RIVQLRTFKVFVSGEVKVPGAVNANSAMRASEVLAQLERLRGASRRNVVVRHADGSTSPVDLDRFERLGRSDLNPTLVDGDMIVVPHRLEYAFVAGAVARPEEFELTAGDSLGTLIALAGGVLPS